jgi:Family of unknown function (DUF6355)
MSSIARIATICAGIVAAVGLTAIGTPAMAEVTQSSPSQSSPRANSLGCGYDGRVNGNPTYNHCGSGSVVIEVDHVFWQHNYACMPRGVHTIPQGNSSWAIIGAEADGHTCNGPYPVSIVGP